METTQLTVIIQSDQHLPFSGNPLKKIVRNRLAGKLVTQSPRV